MKKNIIIFFASILALGAVLFLYNKATNSNISDEEERNFGIPEIEKVDKIFLATKTGITITLEKIGDQWMVNNQFVAREDRIHSLLETAKKVQTKSRVGKSKLETTIKTLSSHHTKAEFYSGGELIKCYYVGGADPSGTGTYMLLIDPDTQENASKPYITHILGFQGYLTPRYDPKVENWRDLKLFYFPENNIQSISINYPGHEEASFKLSLEDGEYKLFNVKGEEIKSSKEQIRKYLLGFKSISAERIVPQSEKGISTLDDLKKESPFFKLVVTDILGRESKVIGHRRKAKKGETNAMGIQLKHDPDRFYGICFDESELTILQYYVFQPLLKTAQEFQ